MNWTVFVCDLYFMFLLLVLELSLEGIDNATVLEDLSVFLAGVAAYTLLVYSIGFENWGIGGRVVAKNSLPKLSQLILHTPSNPNINNSHNNILQRCRNFSIPLFDSLIIQLFSINFLYKIIIKFFIFDNIFIKFF